MTLVKRLIGKSRIQDLDAFPKIPSDYKTKTTTGGTLTAISFILIVVLATNEILMYRSTAVAFRYRVDNDMDSPLEININITVASACEAIGADIIDPTNQNNAYTYGRLTEDAVSFELTPGQSEHWDMVRNINDYLRNQHHTLQDLLWQQDTRSLDDFSRSLPPRETPLLGSANACQLHGVLVVNKVAGNLHVTNGKHVPLPIGHAHISLFGGPSNFNFSHRIEKFSFGQPIPSVVNPLEGEEKIDKTGRKLYQYYIKVVSTNVMVNGDRKRTYQYTVTETEREINHDAGSHGTPGIHFRYDIDAVAVDVVDEHIPILSLVIRICGIVGGVYATSSFLTSFTNIIVDLVTCKYLERVRNDQFKIASGFHSIEGIY